MLNRVAAAVRMEEPVSWAASVPVCPSSQEGAASTTNASGKQEGNGTSRVFLTQSHIFVSFAPLPCGTLIVSSVCRKCGVIPHGEWVQKGCSYCRCGYGVLHCFPNVFNKHCGKMNTQCTTDMIILQRSSQFIIFQLNHCLWFIRPTPKPSTLVWS